MNEHHKTGLLQPTFSILEPQVPPVFAKNKKGKKLFYKKKQLNVAMIPVVIHEEKQPYLSFCSYDL